MTRNPARSLLFFLACAPLAGCTAEDGGPSEEQLQQRDHAAREACIAENLALRAADELQTLEQLTVAGGPLAFQQAYTHHARLRHAAYAQADSALNHSATPRDSLLHEDAAGGFQIRAPEPGSVEENVIRSYEGKFLAIYNDSGHPCNWQSELDAED